MKDEASGEYRLLEPGNTWTLPNVPVPQVYDPLPDPQGNRLYQYNDFYQGTGAPIIAIPSQQTLQQDPAADPYAFQINWGDVWSGFTNQAGDPLICDYFKSGTSPGSSLYGTSQFAVGQFGSRINSMANTCDFS